MATLIDKRLQAICQRNEEEANTITESIKKMAAQKRTNAQLNEFDAGNWTSVKRATMGFIPGHTKVRNPRGEIVNERFRADTFAEYYEEIHWAPNDIENDPGHEVKQEPIYTTCNDINAAQITAEELDQAIKQVKRNKAPGPDGTTAELNKWLDAHNRKSFLDTISECWNNETLHKSMNETT